MLPTIYPFGIQISMYWLCGVLALLLGSALVFAKRKSFGIAKSDLVQTLARTVIGAVGGGKLFHVIGEIVESDTKPWLWTASDWTSVLRPGGVFYGGVICATGLVLLYAKSRKLPIGNISDLMAYFALAFGAGARFSCLFAGCCHGIEVQHMFTVPGTIYATPRLPSPLLESALNIAILLFFLLRKPERKRPGTLFPLYLILYSAGRFVLEFFRGDEGRGSFLIFSTSQWIAIALTLTAGVILYRIRKSWKPT